eukprot:6899705-Pyramimonas_sp.AAC.1
MLYSVLQRRLSLIKRFGQSSGKLQEEEEEEEEGWDKDASVPERSRTPCERSGMLGEGRDARDVLHSRGISEGLSYPHPNVSSSWLRFTGMRIHRSWAMGQAIGQWM